ncbi:hypothetical protein JYQ75_06085 [Anaerobutyricum soehngenii]|uniref:Uncharacterized protein n=1 Tax=Anaerobutyricum soehngenii TaxID=105843 RepID=A0ABS3ZI35_9FIRM|nr:hypothetical protein [Anaerobutyricum soehngenii]
MKRSIAQYHLPGLFEFYELYKVFLPLFREHREYFYDWCDIGSVYGAPADCIWGGGRAGFGDDDARKVLDLMKEYGISARLTFSNSLLREEHILDKKCNALCKLFEEAGDIQRERVSDSNMQNKSIKDIQENNVQPKAIQNGVIVHADLLLDYLKKNYSNLYFVSSTTKVLINFQDFLKEVKREDFQYVVPDFRLNKSFDRLNTLTQIEKDKVEFLCNECCWFGCKDRKRCYETVSRKNLGENCPEHHCAAPDAEEGYRFSKVMKNPGFISTEDIQNVYLPMGFSNFKIEGRGLGSALVLEFLLYYMVKKEYQIHIREAIYLDNMLDLF